MSFPVFRVLYEKFHSLLNNASLKKKLIVSFVFILFIPLATSNILLLNRMNRFVVDSKTNSIKATINQISYNMENSLNLYSQASNLIFFDQRINSILYNNYSSENSLFQMYEAYSTINGILSVIRNTNNDLLAIKIYSSNPSFTCDQVTAFRIDSVVKKQAWYSNAINKRWKEYYSNITPDSGSDSNSNDGVKSNTGYHFYLTRSLTYTQDSSEPAILVLDISEKRFYSLLEKEPLSNKLYIVNDSGYIISSNDRTSISKNFSLLYDFTLGKSKEGTARITSNNIPYLITYTSNSHNWKILSVIPIDDISKIPQDLLVLYYSLYLMCFTVSVLLIILFAKMLTKRLRLFEIYVRNIETDNINISYPLSGEDEIGKIFKAFNHLILRLKDYINEISANELLIRNAEIKALQSQINPHFLYNTMDTIYWLIYRNKNERAASMILELSRFYKAILNKGDSLVSIDEEIQILKRYLFIELEKLDTEVAIHYFIQEECKNIKILKFLLQPFFENILNHAIYVNTTKINIILSINENADHIEINITDDGIGINKTRLNDILNNTNASTGYAIFNIKERLKIYYRDNFTLNIFSKPGIGTKIEIKIPKERLKY